MLKLLKRFLGREKLASKPDPKGLPGTRVYHEYFVSSEAINGSFAWLARVYGANGVVVDQAEGGEKSRDAARRAALKWAETAKDAERGAA